MPDENVAWVRITVYIAIHKDHLTIKKSKLMSNLGDATIPKVRESKSLFYMLNSIICIKLKKCHTDAYSTLPQEARAMH